MNFSKGLTSIFNQVRSKPNPIVVFGIGNYGTMSSRNSIGTKAVEYLAKGLGVNWTEFKECSSKLAYSPENHLLLIQPDTYLVQDNFEVLARLIKLMPNIKSEAFVAVHYEHLFKLGVVDRSLGGRSKHNPGLAGITGVFQTERYNRVMLGVAHPLEDITFEQTLFSTSNVYADLQTPFLLNRFPEVQVELVDKVVIPYACNQTLIAVNEIKEKLSQKELKSDDQTKRFTTSPRLDLRNLSQKVMEQ